ncbi:DUF2087 domain-containing protein [Metapseudomonas otitidis]|uniref:DUF2087 domain-containing protein n=1 Tax=Metapseudomonas otitidis TaxID=319939 RepID=A0A679GPP0_9GAMM|nr:DUF2087 domain-containing protein [Pseudomonas otitidis]BCA31362.1 hypothetical protein PtoMrB4_53390 [Pseudomonas otitidis]
MSKTLIPFSTPDLSALARSLVRQLGEREGPPSHVDMLNLLARARGFRSYQALRASQVAERQLAEPVRAEAVDYVLVRRLLRYFDEQGRLRSWPGKHSHRRPCLSAIWMALPPRTRMSEREVDAHIRTAASLGDHVLLRRELVDAGWLVRTPDGREYRRVEQRPDAVAMALRAQLGRRTG